MTCSKSAPTLIGANRETRLLAVKALKEGRRNSTADQERLQAAHDLLADLGAECDGPGGKAGEGALWGAKQSLTLLAADDDSRPMSPYVAKVAAELLALGHDVDKPMPRKEGGGSTYAARVALELLELES